MCPDGVCRKGTGDTAQAAPYPAGAHRLPFPGHRLQRRHSNAHRLRQLPQQGHISGALFAKAVILAAHHTPTVQAVFQYLPHKFLRRKVVEALKRRAKHQLHPQLLHHPVPAFRALQQLHIAFAHGPVGVVRRLKGKNRPLAVLRARLFYRLGYYRAVPQVHAVKKTQRRHGGIFTFAGKVMEDQQLGFSFV